MIKHILGTRPCIYPANSNLPSASSNPSATLLPSKDSLAACISGRKAFRRSSMLQAGGGPMLGLADELSPLLMPDKRLAIIKLHFQFWLPDTQMISLEPRIWKWSKRELLDFTIALCLHERVHPIGHGKACALMFHALPSCLRLQATSCRHEKATRSYPEAVSCSMEPEIWWLTANLSLSTLVQTVQMSISGHKPSEHIQVQDQGSACPCKKVATHQQGPRLGSPVFPSFSS